MGKPNKKYIPNKAYNPIVQQAKIEQLRHDIKMHEKNIEAIAKSHNTHLEILTNFARHDLKNSVQSIDTILNSNTLEELEPKHIEALKLSISMIRETIDNFSKLVPSGENTPFTLTDLISAIEILNKESFYLNRISFIKDLPDIVFTFDLAFQSVLQLVNNLIINSVKAFTEKCKDRIIKVQAFIEDGSRIAIRFYDNASKISFDRPNSVFEYGVSSTGGSGIGLYHAKYLCSIYQGDITLNINPEDGVFTKYFTVYLPINASTL